MDKDIELYFKGQDNNSKLIYTVGILWGKVSSNLDEILNKYGLNNLEKKLVEWLTNNIKSTGYLYYV